ncbi:polysaccharide deacetylase family protein [Bacillus sp. DX4.1]|uniref:polysaccharide deacetylase family protein n=1 Tax=Bacillus sp. DX4.1 TaxID=3055867 RepID=UPI0025A189F3|nr:polysaccharide deacetylase family protein [Bacillus sp. DX4.1]MDM5189270.1 polysaccharide deacetylase family protein [Bacillus sp. DX4.1]
MKVEKGTIFVDGQPVETDYWIINGSTLVPALFFKHTGVAVDFDNKKYASFFYTKTLFLGLFNLQSDGYFVMKGTNSFQQGLLCTPLMVIEEQVCVPLYEVVQKLGMIVWENQKISRVYVITNTSPTLKPIIYHKGVGDEKQVALSFDDGPDDVYTPKILDVLSRKNIRATFFVVGEQIKLFPEMLKRIVVEGHALGNHSWSHPKFPELTTSELKNEIQWTDEEITSVTGYKAEIVRPPFGLFTNSDLHIIDDLGLKLVMWSVDTLDWMGLPMEHIISTVMREVSSGSIVLQHSLNILPLDGTLEALPVLIDKLASQGYKFVTIPEMLEDATSYS